MKGNILTLEVPRSYFVHADSLFLNLHISDAASVTVDSDKDHGVTTWTVCHMMEWMEHIADDKEKQGHTRTAETYRTTVRRMRMAVAGNDGVLFDALWLADFGRRLLNDGLSLNTIGFYMKRLRAACNLANEAGHSLPDGLFETVYTGNAPTAKRALDAATVGRLAKLEPKRRRSGWPATFSSSASTPVECRLSTWRICVGLTSSRASLSIGAIRRVND